MVTKYGAIIFHQFKILSKQVGEDKAQALVFECIRILEREGYVRDTSSYTNQEIDEKANEIIKFLQEEWKNESFG